MMAAGSKLVPVPSADGQAVLLAMTFSGDAVAAPLDNNKPGKHGELVQID